MFLRKPLFVLAFVLIASFSQFASAALVPFNTTAAFNNQLTASGLNGHFVNAFETTTVTPGLSVTANGVGYTLTGGGDGIQILNAPNSTSTGTKSLAYNGGADVDFIEGDIITLTLPAGTRGLSLRLITQTPQDSLSFGTLTVGSTVAQAQFVPGDPIAGSTSFKSYYLGIVDNSSTISSATLTFTGGGTFYRIDDVGIVAVPEPSSFALAAVVGLVGFARRRNRRS